MRAPTLGESANIKLDVFHAIQRITRKIPKRHPLFQQCKNELKLMVRDPTDAGKIRTLPTTSSETMIKTLESFEKKWKINEALHRHINPSFTNKCRIGLPLALALLTILLIDTT